MQRFLFVFYQVVVKECPFHRLDISFKGCSEDATEKTWGSTLPRQTMCQLDTLCQGLGADGIMAHPPSGRCPSESPERPMRHIVAVFHHYHRGRRSPFPGLSGFSSHNSTKNNPKLDGKSPDQKSSHLSGEKWGAQMAGWSGEKVFLQLDENSRNRKVGPPPQRGGAELVFSHIKRGYGLREDLQDTSGHHMVFIPQDSWLLLLNWPGRLLRIILIHSDPLTCCIRKLHHPPPSLVPLRPTHGWTSVLPISTADGLSNSWIPCIPTTLVDRSEFCALDEA